MAAMTENSKKVFTFLQENKGEDITLNGIASALQMDAKAVNGYLVGMQKKGLITREEVDTIGADGKKAVVKYIRLTVLADTFDPDVDPTPAKK